MYRCIARFASTILILGQLSALAGAADSVSGFVSGEARVRLQPPPTALRVQVQLCSYGNTVTVALERLKARREVALEKLRALEPERKSIAVANPSVLEKTPPRLALRAPVPSPLAPTPPLPRIAVDDTSSPEAPRERPPALAERSSGPGLLRLFAASQMLAADWALAADDPGKLLTTAHAIREKVKWADVGGRNDPQDLTDKEQELVSETLVVATPSGPYARAPYSSGRSLDDMVVIPEVPRFLYVARLTPKQRKSALAEAFSEARHQAGELAEAAGAHLGPLVELTGRVAPDAGGLGRSKSSAPATTFSSDADGHLTLISDPCEVISDDPNALRFSFLLSARFRLD